MIEERGPPLSTRQLQNLLVPLDGALQKGIIALEMGPLATAPEFASTAPFKFQQPLFAFMLCLLSPQDAVCT